ncbi:MULTISPECIES: DUF998 domain-containing protein [Actinokineospora]|uniref:DUF998 domain-containing protein n=1 Tax=Actinokineospora TaxID=39845 RepID=UPI001E44210B|nr:MULTISPECIES: DUF998 domain-containing protein [Actinokineospora]UVS78996.1 hypothetical protein Actkin_02736 [Actinokineospora sp. UTMC 2448]
MDRRLPLLGLTSLLAGVMVFLALHVLPPTSGISPVRRTLSEYALGESKWAFDLAVVLIALGSALVFAELLRRGHGRFAVVMGAVWTASLVVVVVFTKTDWSVGPSLGGTIHRYASVAAFLSLPVAVMAAAGAVFPAAAGWRLLTRALSAVSLAWFGTIVVGVVNMAMGGVSWWRFVPLGLVERMIAGFAVAGLAVLVLGLLRANRQAALPR